MLIGEKKEESPLYIVRTLPFCYNEREFKTDMFIMIRSILNQALMPFIAATGVAAMGDTLQVRPLDYGRVENWLVNESSADLSDKPCDLFYIYPTLTADKTKPLMDMGDEKVSHKAIGFATAQIELFKHTRPFAPFVRQLEYHRSMEHLRGEKDYSDYLDVGMQDATDAFRYYLKHWNGGRPFVLFGHSQGARNLYEVLKRCPEITEDRGFVAAYLLGLPATTAEKIRTDFAGRGILPAAGEDDTAVIICWNTQTPDAENPVYSMKNGFVINPLNWRTDETPATKEQNIGAVFYNYRELNPARRHGRKANFCGAQIDAEKGVLVVDLLSNSAWDAHSYVGKGVLHMNDFWFFAENVISNVQVRADAWKAKHP